LSRSRENGDRYKVMAIKILSSIRQNYSREPIEALLSSGSEEGTDSNARRGEGSIDAK